MGKVFGIDCSHWQNDKSTPQKMDWVKAKKEGVKFAFIKVSERGGVDLDFVYNWQAAKMAGIPRGGYHFLRWDLSGLLQARIFCDLLKDDPGELPPVADFEAPMKDGLYPSNSLLQQFLEEVETRLGKKPIIYTSVGFWNTNGKNKGTSIYDSKWLYWDLWIARYITYNKDAPLTDYMEINPDLPLPWKGKKPWTFWQFTPGGDGLKYGAESKGLDLNFFNGDEHAFNEYMGVSIPTPPDQPAPTPDELTARVQILEKNVSDLNAWAKNLSLK